MSNAALISNSTAFPCVQGMEMIILKANQRYISSVMLPVCTLEKYPPQCCCLGAGEVELLRGAPVTLTPVARFILSDSCSSSPGQG